jgi:hypothetical protein
MGDISILFLGCLLTNVQLITGGHHIAGELYITFCRGTSWKSSKLRTPSVFGCCPFQARHGALAMAKAVSNGWSKGLILLKTELVGMWNTRPGKCLQKAIENCHRNRGFTPLKMVIFHSYVSLPEGNWTSFLKETSFCWLNHDQLMNHELILSFTAWWIMIDPLGK